MKINQAEKSYKDPTASVTGLDMMRLTGPLAATKAEQSTTPIMISNCGQGICHAIPQ